MAIFACLFSSFVCIQQPKKKSREVAHSLYCHRPSVHQVDLLKTRQLICYNYIALYTKCKYGRPTIFCLGRFSRKEKQLNNDYDQVKISHYVHFQGHILILGEVIGNQILGKT